MATTTDGHRTDVFKFHGTGLAALCIEVADLIRDGTAERWGLDLDSAQYVDEDGLHIIRFQHKPSD